MLQSHNANLILQNVWKSKVIPPLLKTFAWRLIRRALATGERAGGYSTNIDKHCSYCGQIENDVHLFFKCHLPSQVWAASTPPLPTHSISEQEDGVQTALPLLISPTPSDDTLCNTLFTLWYLWKARNDNRFQRKTWTSFQVRKAAQAHMHNYAQAFHDDDDAQQATTQILPGQMQSGGNLDQPNSANLSNRELGSTHHTSCGQVPRTTPFLAAWFQMLFRRITLSGHSASANKTCRNRCIHCQHRFISSD